MAEVGQVLRRKREELGLSMDDIQTKTKIRKRYIEAIEAEDWSVLPGNVYTRGFIRSYADALGLDGFELLNQLDAQSSEVKHIPQSSTDGAESGTEIGTGSRRATNSYHRSEEPSAKADEQGNNNDEAVKDEPVVPEPRRHEQPVSSPPAKSHAVNETLRRTRKPKRTGVGVPVGQIAIVVIGLGILGTGWWVLNHQGNKGTGASVPANNQPQTSVSANSTGGSTGQQTGNATVNNTTTSTPKSVFKVTSKPFDSKTGTQTYIVNSSKNLSVKMQAQPACWMRIVKLDGKAGNPGGLTVQPKQPKTWTANNLVDIRLGHVHGVTLSVNGHTVNLPAVNQPIYVMFKKSSKS